MVFLIIFWMLCFILGILIARIGYHKFPCYKWLTLNDIPGVFVLAPLFLMFSVAEYLSYSRDN